MARTATEIQAEIDEIIVAMASIRKGGQSYTFTAGPGGTSRTVTMADYNALKQDRADLERELRTVNGTSQINIRAGW